MNRKHIEQVAKQFENCAHIPELCGALLAAMYRIEELERENCLLQAQLEAARQSENVQLRMKR